MERNQIDGGKAGISGDQKDSSIEKWFPWALQSYNQILNLKQLFEWEDLDVKKSTLILILLLHVSQAISPIYLDFFRKWDVVL